MVLADLPYGVTACKWDTPLPLDDLWLQFERIAKQNAAMVFTATQPFASNLVMSKPTLFRYEWIWDKLRGSNFLLARKRPMKRHENVLIFSHKPTQYNPQMRDREGNKRWGYPPKPIRAPTEIYDVVLKQGDIQEKALPHSILKFPVITNNNEIRYHATQKPVALFEYLIRTYTNDGDTVLDPTAGSGTTAVACKRSERHYICIEKEPEYCAIAEKRLAEIL